MGFELELRGVTKRYGEQSADMVALDHVDLSVPSAEVVAVMGPSGSGKSTLLHVIGAMDRPDEGAVMVAGRDVTGLSRREQAYYRQTIGFVFQQFHLLPALTVLDNVVSPVLPYRVDFDKFQRARELLRSLGLGNRETALPSKLSGGEQQRVAIARSLINGPGLLLADEPTGNLDSETSTEIMDIILSLRTDRGMTVIVATHDPLVATRGDRIVRLQDGAVVEDYPVPRGEADDTLGRITRLDPGQQG
jgi:putative ABC transport system ATP-binding protein